MQIAKQNDFDALPWRRVSVVIRDPSAAVAKANWILSAIGRAYREKGCPQDVLVFHDLSISDEYVILLSPDAFALFPTVFGEVETRVEFCARPSPRADLKRFPL